MSTSCVRAHLSHCTQVRDIVSKKAEIEVIASDASEVVNS